VTVIEWGERIATVLPAERLTVDLRFAPPDPTGPGRTGSQEGATAGSSEVGDNRRQLRFELAGEAWIERCSQLEAAMMPWRAPC
jgi:hypothetical protein